MVSHSLHIKDPEIEAALWKVTDPEIPVLSVMDMGVIRSVEVVDQQLKIQITPTYSGCPAMDTIAADISSAMKEIGKEAEIELVLSPAWTTDWITAEGRAKLEAYGIAAPLDGAADKLALIDGKKLVKCPRCATTNTKMISQFGSTACKALFQCEECLEPFDYFKCLK